MPCDHRDCNGNGKHQRHCGSHYGKEGAVESRMRPADEQGGETFGQRLRREQRPVDTVLCQIRNGNAGRQAERGRIDRRHQAAENGDAEGAAEFVGHFLDRGDHARLSGGALSSMALEAAVIAAPMPRPIMMKAPIRIESPDW